MPKTISELQETLTPVFESYGVTRVILFGSYACDKATDKSDVDLLVNSSLHGLRFVGFMEAVASVLDIPVDIFDVSHIESGSRIDREIRETGVTIYENGSICAPMN